MRSPFPGMDPYIETSGHWADFHSKLIADIEREVATRLPERFYIELSKRSCITLVGQEGKETHGFVPDVKVTTPTSGAADLKSQAALTESITDVEAMTMEVVVAEEFEETFIEIYEVNDTQELVTCVEVLSPSNKRPIGDGRIQYLRKRQAVLLGKSNLVEIDLLRGGTRMPMRSPWPNSPYTLLVCRGESARNARVWKAGYKKRLPVVPLPLRPPHQDVSLDLQALIEAVYDRSRYDERIDYSKPLDPELSAEEVAWLAETLKARESQP